MIVYMVQNNDGIIIAICIRKSKAKKIVEEIGHRRWHEDWQVTPVTIDEVDSAMLAGSDSYKRLCNKLANKAMEHLK